MGLIDSGSAAGPTEIMLMGERGFPAVFQMRDPRLGDWINFEARDYWGN